MEEIKELLGQEIIEIEGLVNNSAMVRIVLPDKAIKIHHHQNCCENVVLVDFENDTNDNISGPLILLDIEEHSSDAQLSRRDFAGESTTWTFYFIKTNRGDIFLRWLGESNGYYSESVDVDVVGINE